MAKSSTRRVSFYINGKEIEASVKQVRAEMNRLVNEQNKMVIGSDEYVAHAKKIRELRSILKEHSQEIANAKSQWQELYDKVMQFGMGVGGFTQIFEMADNAISTLKQLATDLAEMDDIYSDVMKTTGFTHDQVEELNKSFKAMDTRTSREQLNNLAYIAGKLGLNTKELVTQFVEAADVINVSMGDVLGDDATLAIGKMADVYKRTSETLEEKDLKGQLLSIGSAVNELGQSSSANEAYMVNFAGRLGGIAVQAKLSADQILGYASALDQDMQKVEMSATAFQKLIQKIISKPADFAKIAGVELKEFNRLIREDMNGAIKAVLKGFQGSGGFAQLLPLFKDLGLDSARAASAISSMANSLDKVEEAQAIANKAMLEGVSCLNEFNTKNNNLQANLEKARKKFKDNRIELGEKLYPILINLTKTSTASIKIISQLVNWFSKNKIAFVALIAPISLYLAKLVLLHSKVLLINAVEKAGIAIKTAQKAITYALAAAQAKLAGNTTRAAVAQRAFHAAAAATPWTAIATAVAALAVGIYKFSSHLTKSQSSVKEFRTRMAEQKVQTDLLFDSIRHLKKGTEEYNKVQKKIIETYPQLLQDQLDEKGNIIDIEAAYNKVITAQKKKIALAIQEEKMTEIMQEQMERLSISLEHLSPEIGQKTVELAEEGWDANKIIRAIDKWILKNKKLSAEEQLWIRNIVTIVAEETKKIEKVKQTLAPWIGNQLNAVLEEIEQEETEDEKKEAALLEEKVNKKKDEWERLKEQVQKIANKDELIGKNKTEQDKLKIKQEYGELADKIETYISSKGKVATELANEVRQYMENSIADIDKAAREEKMKKVGDSFDKLCEQLGEIKRKTSENLNDKYANELATIQAEWDKLINDLDESITFYQSKLSEEYNADAGTGLSEEELALLNKLLDKKKEMITMQYEAEMEVVSRAEQEITTTLMEEQERQKETIRKNYEDKISIARSAITKLKQLNEEENKDRIQQLEEQIVQLQQKMEAEIETVGSSKNNKKASGIGALLQIDWKNFKKDWEHNLAEIADVIQEFANSAMQIFNSVNELQSNKDQAMLNRYKENYDARKEKLDWQLEEGIISQEYYNAKIDKLDKERDIKEKAIEIEQFRREKRAALAETIISGIVSAVKSFENGGGFPWGLIPMALSLATTGVQIAAIESQPEPYALGGYINKRKIILAGEAGKEWMASHPLLENPQTAPIISALDSYQKGNKKALRAIQFAEPDSGSLSQAAIAISRNFVPQAQTNISTTNNIRNPNAYKTQNFDLMLKEITALREYMSDPKNRRAVISRDIQLEFEQQEKFLRNVASLK